MGSPLDPNIANFFSQTLTLDFFNRLQIDSLNYTTDLLMIFSAVFDKEYACIELLNLLRTQLFFVVEIFCGYFWIYWDLVGCVISTSWNLHDILPDF